MKKVSESLHLRLNGIFDVMKKWMKLTDEQRRDIMIDLGLRPGEFEILAGHAVP